MYNGQYSFQMSAVSLFGNESFFLSFVSWGHEKKETNISFPGSIFLQN